MCELEQTVLTSAVRVSRELIASSTQPRLAARESSAPTFTRVQISESFGQTLLRKAAKPPVNPCCRRRCEKPGSLRRACKMRPRNFFFLGAIEFLTSYCHSIGLDGEPVAGYYVDTPPPAPHTLHPFPCAEPILAPPRRMAAPKPRAEI